ncbi:MAG: ATP-binding protein [Candidatus Cloacimonetes bacterium]|nr:ATP-binding protein [Candidatus Cloacimonadota bacterium]
MKRQILQHLLRWKEDPNHQPLLIRGVRQCGKTWVMKRFGEENYSDTAYFNFESDESLREFFEGDLDVSRIIKSLGVQRGKTIMPGTTLVIFDEIQFCPRALTALKYFCEEMPELHVLCAGSLLGVALAKPLSFPVGKVELVTLRPMNFYEFCIANGGEMLADHLASLPAGEPLPAAFTGRLEEYYRDYLICGGMPAVVSSWIERHDIGEVERIQQQILDTYSLDFVKHAPINDFPKLSLIWNAIPLQLAKENSKFLFSHVKKGARARDLEDALQWLIDAGLIYKIEKADRPYIPLSMYADASYFKIYLADVGLLRKMSKFPASALLSSSPLAADMRGALTENYVLGEVMSVTGEVPYFWRSERTAEVDFLVQDGEEIIPIEVKAGKNTRAKSLQEYRKKFSPGIAVRVSLQEAARHSDENGTLIEMPLYLIWMWKTYLDAVHGQSDS